MLAASARRPGLGSAALSAQRPRHVRPPLGITALNISVNAARLSVEELRERCAPMVIEHAGGISSEIANR